MKVHLFNTESDVINAIDEINSALNLGIEKNNVTKDYTEYGITSDNKYFFICDDITIKYIGNIQDINLETQ